MTHRRIPQTVDVIRRRLLEPAPYDHPQTISNAPMARRTIDVVPLLSPQDHGLVNGNRKSLNVFPRSILTLIKLGVLIKGPTRVSTLHRLPCTAPIGKKITGPMRPILGLILHIKP